MQKLETKGVIKESQQQGSQNRNHALGREIKAQKFESVTGLRGSRISPAESIK
jgi:hypothetical protein